MTAVVADTHTIIWYLRFSYHNFSNCIWWWLLGTPETRFLEETGFLIPPNIKKIVKIY